MLESSHLVDEAAVIGVSDTEWGETVKAVLVLSPGAREEDKDEDELRGVLQSYARERLASYKMPAYVAFVDELPRNPMGKVLKNDLRRDHGEPDNA